MSEAFELHVEKTREKINSLPRGSREWWRLNRSLLGRSQKQNVSSPPLRDEKLGWILENDKKAELFADTFVAKAKLPAVEGEWKPKQLGTEQSDLLLLRTKASEAILNNLNSDKATGPDALPATFLKICAAELAEPVTFLARRMLACEEWPECWRSHWIAPIHKKGSVSDSTKYRGVHLTSVLSKVLEGVIAQVLVTYLEVSGASRESQWGFRVGHSCRDLVALLTSTWILHLRHCTRYSHGWVERCIRYSQVGIPSAPFTLLGALGIPTVRFKTVH